MLRALLVAIRSTHEVVWALLLVSVLGLDPLAAVLAIAVPFGAQTAKVFADTLDAVPAGPLHALRNAGARPLSALVYGLLPGAAALLLSYSFYRFECAIRSTVLLGVVGVGGLGQELTVSLQSRNWDEVWTLIAAVLVLSALVDRWGTWVRADVAVASCSDWSSGQATLPRHGRTTTVTAARRFAAARWSIVVAMAGSIVAWWASEVSPAGLGAPRTGLLATRLLADLWPPGLPAGGLALLWTAVLDTVAMAVLAMAVAVVVTVFVAPWATRSRTRTSGGGAVRSVLRVLPRWAARSALLVLRSIPTTVWAIIALLVLFPGILPGALALGLYTGGILGRLVAEAWETVDPRPADALHNAGVRSAVAYAAAIVPPSAHHLLTYTLYRFEICVRDTAVVGVVGAAGLGRLIAENLNTFRFPVVTTLLLTSFAVSALSELLGRRVRHSLER